MNFNCTNCGQTISVPPEAAGKTIRCPYCDVAIQAPVAQAKKTGFSPAQPQQKENIYCPTCGQPSAPGPGVCSGCGSPLIGRAKSILRRKKPSVIPYMHPIVWLIGSYLLRDISLILARSTGQPLAAIFALLAIIGIVAYLVSFIQYARSKGYTCCMMLLFWFLGPIGLILLIVLPPM